MTRTTRTHHAAIVVAIIVALVGVGVAVRDTDEPVEAPDPAARAAAWSPHDHWRPQEPAPAAVTTPARRSLTPMIDAVLVDRTTVCIGEPATVSVKARSGLAMALHVSVDGTAGDAVPVTFNAPGEHVVTARIHGAGDAVDERELAIEVRDCGNRFQYVRIAGDPILGTDADKYRFVARPFFARSDCDRSKGERVWSRCNAEPEPGEHLSYHWQFGDGTDTTSDQPYVEHDFSDRVQANAESYFLVEVEVRRSRGDALTGRIPVAFANLNVENKLTAGVITPSAFARCDRRTDGEPLRCEVALRNPDSAAVSLDDVDVTLSPCDSGEPQTIHLAAGSLLTATTVAPGRSSAQLELAATAIPSSACSVAFHARGRAGSYRAELLFGATLQETTVALGPAEAAADPATKRRYDRVIKALQVLGRDSSDGPVTITEEEIRELEMRGQLD